MFDLDLEVSDLERDLSLIKKKMEVIFNFIDLSFQMYDGSFDDNVNVTFTIVRKLLTSAAVTVISRALTFRKP